MSSVSMPKAVKVGLQKFLKLKSEYDSKAEKGPYGYVEDFAILRRKTLQYRDERTYDYSEGEKPYNYRKNRYKDILPYDYTRVKLTKLNEMPGTDYINANYINGANDKTNYIAAQGPLPNTVKDFWRMLWENKSKVVLMACSEYEGDPPKHKCERYWPISLDEVLKFDQISVSLEKEIDTEFPDYRVRHIRVECEREVHRLHQLNYVGWPDHGVPNNVDSIIDMLTTSRNLQGDDPTPMIVHCSAGCGRTGTIMAIDYAWTLLKTGKIGDDFDLFSIIDDMRMQRPSLVQSLDQYRFVFDTVAEVFERHQDTVKKHAYENVELVMPGNTEWKSGSMSSGCSVDSAFGDETYAQKGVQSKLNNPPVASPRTSIISERADNQDRRPTNAPLNLSDDHSNAGKPPPAVKPQGSNGSDGAVRKNSYPEQRASCVPSQPLSAIINIFNPDKLSTKPNIPISKPITKPGSCGNKPDVSVISSEKEKKDPNLFIQLNTSGEKANNDMTNRMIQPRVAPKVELKENFDSYSFVACPSESSSGNQPAFQVRNVCKPTEEVDVGNLINIGDEYTMAVDASYDDAYTEKAVHAENNPEQYAYANPLNKEKWSLQHYAFPNHGKTEDSNVYKSTEIASSAAAYIDIDMNSETCCPLILASSSPPDSKVDSTAMLPAKTSSAAAYTEIDMNAETNRPTMLVSPAQADTMQYADITMVPGKHLAGIPRVSLHDSEGYCMSDEFDEDLDEDDDFAPDVPQKAHGLMLDTAAEASEPLGTVTGTMSRAAALKTGKFFNNLFNRQKNGPQVTYDGRTPEVTLYGRLISFPKRVGTPIGPRQRIK